MAEREVWGGTLPYCPSLAITPNPGSRGQQEEERAGWRTVQSLGGGRQSQLHKYKRGRDMLACLPMHTEPAPPHNGITPSPMTWHSLLTVYNTGTRHPPPTLHRTPELDALQPTSCGPCQPSLSSSRAGFFQPEPRSLYCNLWKLVSDAAAPAYYLFISSFLPAETLLSEGELQSGDRERQKLQGELGAKRR